MAIIYGLSAGRCGGLAIEQEAACRFQSKDERSLQPIGLSGGVRGVYEALEHSSL